MPVDPYNSFIPPPEAPVFTPSEEEFQDPLGYLAKIKPIAEKTGICKIKPPPDWQPPFAVDVEKFKFTPRVQRLNELEAKTRVKLNFLDKLAKFWELQGCSLKIPHVEKKLLDLYTLYKIVEDEGGVEMINKERKWGKVANRMNCQSGKCVGGALRMHYEKILYPYFLFKQSEGILGERPADAKPIKIETDLEDRCDRDYKPSMKSVNAGNRRMQKRSNIKEEDDPIDIDYSSNSELKKLQFFGAGPKAAVPTSKEEVKKIGKQSKQEKRGGNPVYSIIDTYICRMCDRGDGDEYMLLCDGCDDAFHTYCLIPPMPEVPKGDWRCPRCIQQVCSKPLEPYGFDQSKREFTLQSFGEMADQFKSNYFNMPVHMVSCATAEKEFWRLVNCIEEDVCVQYGADIHAAEMGSGFPTKENKDLFPDDEVYEYINSGWNLNNLPILEQSVLCHINADISGMKIPWCYVGMCFSSFCWHNEDHWSYSINYLHWGEPKTWYGVPGECAEQFEEAMKANAPELFEHSPDLLHQLTTIMNPNILMDMGVPIVRTNQHAGEFVVTFPRSYHAGFNQGYNFAEAVNFAPADWLPIGRLCIEHYRLLHRQCVFSHEELICKMAADPDNLDIKVAASTYQDLLVIVEMERNLRKKLLDRGITEAEREAFELLADDERQCDHCKTTLFLSGVTCSCNSNRVVCLHHFEQLCKCPPVNQCLRYRYTLDELPSMLQKLKIRAESFDNWTAKVTEAMEATGDDRLDLLELKELITEAEEKRYPDTEMLNSLKSSVVEAEKCASVANQLVTRKVRTRNRQSMEGKYIAKLSLEELNCFYEQVFNLPCIIKEAKLVKELLDKVIEFQKDAQNALNAETPDSEKLEQLIDFSVTLDVDLPEIPRLKQVLLQAKWLDEVRDTLREPLNVTLDVMREMMDRGVGLAPHPAVEKAMAELQDLLTVSERWEEKARICLQARPRHVMATLEAIINEAKGIPAYLPNVATLKDALRKAKEWTTKVEKVQNSESYPYLDILESLVNKGRPIPVRLDQLPQVESQVATAKSWRERTARTFLKKNCTYSLLEVLSPRHDIGIYGSGKNKKKKLKEGEKERRDSDSHFPADYKAEETRDPAAIVASFKIAEAKEVEAMQELRQRNMCKVKQLGDPADVKYCVCRKGTSGYMLQCELCKDWFHGTCVPLPKAANMKNKSSQAAAIQAAKELKFLCPLCLRSRRPRLETILSLLVSLQKLPVRLPEGEALQCLTERAMAWQDRARQALTTSELASALAKLSLLSQKMVEQAAREKTEKIINAELMKAANNPDLQGHLASVTQSAFGGTGGPNMPLKQIDSGNYSMDSDNSFTLPMSPQSSQNSDDIQMEVEISSSSTPTHGSLSNGVSEHAYSSVSKSSNNASPRKHARKTPLIARQMEAPVLELSDIAKGQLEELMMEGDLLEVSLDETQHIWRILQACKPRGDGKMSSESGESKDQHQTGDHISSTTSDKLQIKIKKEKDPEKKKKKRKKLEEGTDGTKIKKLKQTEENIKKPKKLKVKIKKEFDPSKQEDSKEELKEMIGSPVLDSSMATIANEAEKIKKAGEKAEKLKRLSEDKPKKKKKIKKEGQVTPLDESVKKKRKPKVKREKKGKDNPMMTDDGDDDDSEEDCAALKCLKPTGEEVNWVQCDQCEAWYHLLCVGLGQEEVAGDEDYVCFKCKNKDNIDYSIPPMTHPHSLPSSSSDISSALHNDSEIKTEPVDQSCQPNQHVQSTSSSTCKLNKAASGSAVQDSSEAVTEEQARRRSEEILDEVINSVIQASAPLEENVPKEISPPSVAVEKQTIDNEPPLETKIDQEILKPKEVVTAGGESGEDVNVEVNATSGNPSESESKDTPCPEQSNSVVMPTSNEEPSSAVIMNSQNSEECH